MYRKIAKLLLIARDELGGWNVYAHMKYLQNTQWMKRSELKRLQFKKMKALLRHAYENVPFYHSSFKSVNFHPNYFTCLEDVSKIPVLTKPAIRDNLENMVASNATKMQLLRWRTSGTTAAPTNFYRSKADVSWSIAAELRGYNWAGYEVGDKVAMIGYFPPELFDSFAFKLTNFLNRNKILLVNKLSEKTMDSFAKKMARFQPLYIRGNCGQVNIFAIFILNNCSFRLRPKAVFTTGETLYSHYRKTIEEAFDCKVYDYYGSNEVSQAAMQCGQDGSLHILEENVLVEVVKNGEQASAGEQGQVLLTNLNSYAMPYIRYDVGDVGRIFNYVCSCGRELSLFRPLGRKLEYFVNHDGSFTFFRDFQLLLEDIPIQDFQVVQESYDDIVMNIVPKSGFEEKHADFIVKNAKSLGPANVRIELVNSLPLTRTGKIRHKVSKIATKYT